MDTMNLQIHPRIRKRPEIRTAENHGRVDATLDCNLSAGTQPLHKPPREAVLSPGTPQAHAQVTLGAWHARSSMLWLCHPPSLLVSAVMAVCGASQALTCGVTCSRSSWKGEVAYSRQEFFSSKSNLSVKHFRNPSEGASTSIRSSAANPDNGGYASGCRSDAPCALTCPVNRDTYVHGWLQESVHEIVRNIQEAPFLQYVFDAKRRSQRQKISHDLLQNPQRWFQSPLRYSFSKSDPDGIILVQKLDPSSCTDCLAETLQSGERGQCSGGDTDVWGVLVQARGVNGNACYLLETTRVASPGGVCTRYCLTRAKCFGASYGHQLQDSWLL